MNRETLIGMSISQLRGLDIKEKVDELLVQEILDEKLRDEPGQDLNRVSLPSERTDRLTPEKEAELQAILDGKIEQVVEPVQVETVQVATVVEQNVEVEIKAFCAFCTAKGPIKHKNNCTKKSSIIQA